MNGSLSEGMKGTGMLKNESSMCESKVEKNKTWNERERKNERRVKNKEAFESR